MLKLESNKVRPIIFNKPCSIGIVVNHLQTKHEIFIARSSESFSIPVIRTQFSRQWDNHKGQNFMPKFKRFQTAKRTWNRMLDRGARLPLLIFFMFELEVSVNSSWWLVFTMTNHTVHQLLVGGVTWDVQMHLQGPKKKILIIIQLGSVLDPWHFGVDPDPRIHASDLWTFKMPSKNQFFYTIFSACYF